MWPVSRQRCIKSTKNQHFLLKWPIQYYLHPPSYYYSFHLISTFTNLRGLCSLTSQIEMHYPHLPGSTPTHTHYHWPPPRELTLTVYNGKGIEFEKRYRITSCIILYPKEYLVQCPKHYRGYKYLLTQNSPSLLCSSSCWKELHSFAKYKGPTCY